MPRRALHKRRTCADLREISCSAGAFDDITLYDRAAGDNNVVGGGDPRKLIGMQPDYYYSPAMTAFPYPGGGLLRRNTSLDLARHNVDSFLTPPFYILSVYLLLSRRYLRVVSPFAALRYARYTEGNSRASSNTTSTLLQFSLSLFAPSRFHFSRVLARCAAPSCILCR